MRELDLYDDTWIIVTADHGELFGEHGARGHGKHLYHEVTHVPLIVKYPWGEVPPRRDDERVQLADLLPMICARLELEPPDDIQGQAPPDVSHPIVAESYVLPQVTDTGDWRTLHEDGFKLHWNSLGHHMLYDMESDPSESVDLASSRPERLGTMIERLSGYLASLPPPPESGPPGEIDAETREALKSLGYIE